MVLSKLSQLVPGDPPRIGRGKAPVEVRGKTWTGFGIIFVSSDRWVVWRPWKGYLKGGDEQPNLLYIMVFFYTKTMQRKSFIGGSAIGQFAVSKPPTLTENVFRI